MIAIKLEEFIDTQNLDKLGELYEVLTEERLSVKDTGINYRVINHWDEKGIIRFTRKTKEGNRKFSFVDFIWIKVVNELRSFGVKLPVIQKIANDIYEPIPIKELMAGFAENLHLLNEFEGEDKKGMIDFLKSGEYKTADLSDFTFNYLQVLVSEAIATRNPVSIIVFNDGNWLPYLKSNENLYPKELLEKKELYSQVRISITNLIFSFIMEDYMKDYLNELHLFTPEEVKLLYYIKENKYKKVFVLFKSKKHEPIEIKKSKKAGKEIIRILREKQYREFILVDNKNNEFRIRVNDAKSEAKLSIVQ